MCLKKKKEKKKKVFVLKCVNAQIDLVNCYLVRLNCPPFHKKVLLFQEYEGIK